MIEHYWIMLQTIKILKQCNDIFKFFEDIFIKKRYS